MSGITWLLNKTDGETSEEHQILTQEVSFKKRIVALWISFFFFFFFSHPSEVDIECLT